MGERSMSNCSYCHAPDGKPHTKTCLSRLVNYGIQNEESDIRAHVGVLAGKVYVYRTADGLMAIEQWQGEARPAYQPGVSYPTALGYPLPWRNIHRVLAIPCKGFIDYEQFSDSDSTSSKGEKASSVVERLIRSGYFPLPADPTVIKDSSIQRKGIDLIVSGKWRIQVKCDFRAGDGPGCTGNLFLQVAESNPLKAI